MIYEKLLLELNEKDENKIGEVADFVGISADLLIRKLKGIVPLYCIEAQKISDYLGTESIEDKLAFFYPQIPKVGQKQQKKR